MRIAERLRIQEVGVLAYLRRPMQTGAGVIQIHVAVLVQSSVLGGAKRVQMQRGPVVRVALEKLRVRVGLRCATHFSTSLLLYFSTLDDPHVIVIVRTFDCQTRAEHLAQTW